MVPSPKQDIWLVLGAGISCAAPSNIPVWSEMKNATTAFILDALIEVDSRQWHTPPDSFQFERTSSDLQRAISMPEVVMESLCNVYLESTIKEQLASVIAPHSDAPQTNECHTFVARLARLGGVKGIITPNYDSLLERAFDEERISYQVVLPSQASRGSTALPIYKVHGTITAPETLSFLRTTYMRGLPHSLVVHLLNAMRNSLIIVCGYSGNDFDLFPLIRKAITDPTANNQTIVVDPSDLSQNSPYAALAAKVTFVKEQGAAFFGRMLNKAQPAVTSSSTRRSAVLVPHKEPFECALFVGDALVSMKEYGRAYNYFYLADDIASDVDNRCGRGLATIGRGLCLLGLRQNQRGVKEIERGRAMLEPIDLEETKSWLGFPSEGRRITAWLMRAHNLVALTALAVCTASSERSKKEQLVRIASIHSSSIYMGDAGWDAQTVDAIKASASAVKEVVEAYEAFLKSDPSCETLFARCMDFCQSTGCVWELLFCIHLLMRTYPQRRSEYETKLWEVADTVSSDLHGDIRTLFERPGEEFEFRHMEWRW